MGITVSVYSCHLALLSDICAHTCRDRTLVQAGLELLALFLPSASLALGFQVAPLCPVVFISFYLCEQFACM